MLKIDSSRKCNDSCANPLWWYRHNVMFFFSLCYVMNDLNWKVHCPELWWRPEKLLIFQQVLLWLLYWNRQDSTQTFTLATTILTNLYEILFAPMFNLLWAFSELKWNIHSHLKWPVARKMNKEISLAGYDPCQDLPDLRHLKCLAHLERNLISTDTHVLHF